SVPLNWSKYTDTKSRIGFFRPLMEEVATRPGVTSVAMTQSVPLNESQPFNVAFVVEGQAVAPDAPKPQVDFEVVSQEFFKTIGAPLLRGRAFTDQDHDTAPKVVLVNDVMVRHHFQGVEPVGHRISLDGGDEWRTIVGVVGNVKQFTLDKASTEQVYIPFLQAPRVGTLLVRTSGDPWGLVGPIREIVRRLDEKQPIGRVRTLEQVRSETLASPRLTAILIGLFALLALIITTAGIVGVVSYSVSQRTQEIGVRMALGADRATVVRMVLRQGLMPVLIGLAAGMVGALALTKLIARLLFDVAPTDPVTFAAVVLSLVAAAALACWQPARRAAGIEPMLALRSD
ncbi:MAG TPA: FtsX-like permease family protein, partial [Verrucomicrobiae bacterium]|nr:FtsX-like permease family protein [Verrucomicrobiae bacterium]